MAHKAIFLDRDNTLIHDPGYISDPEQVKLMEGAAAALIAFHRMGYKLVLVTNQSAVARGMITEAKLREIHDRLEYLLAQKGASLDRIYFCPYHEEGTVKKYSKSHDWRKPNPGMLLTAAQEMKLDLAQSWCIGDRASDIEAGLNAGCRTILISATTPVPQKDNPDLKPDFVAVNLREAVNIVKKMHQQGNPPAPTPVEAKPQESIPTADVPSKTAPPTPDNPSEPRAPESPPMEQNKAALKTLNEPTTDQLLKNILDQLRAMQRQEMFSEFSYVRFIAGIAQMVVLLCLLLAVWFLMSSQGETQNVSIALGFAGVLQVMALTFYLMDQRS